MPQIPTATHAPSARVRPTTKSRLVTSTPLAKPALATTAVNTVITDHSAMGKALANIGANMTDFAIKSAVQQENLDLLRYKNDLNKEYDAFEVVLRDKPPEDPMDYTRKYNQSKEEALSKLQIGKSEKFKLQSEALLQNKSVKFGFIGFEMAATTRRMDWFSEYENQADVTLNNYSRTGDEHQYKRDVNSMVQTIDDGVKSGTITLDTAIKLANQYESKEHSAILNSIQLNPANINKVVTFDDKQNPTNVGMFSDNTVLQNAAQYRDLAIRLSHKEQEDTKSMNIQTLKDMVATAAYKDVDSPVDLSSTQAVKAAYGTTNEQTDNLVAEYNRNRFKRNMSDMASTITDIATLDEFKESVINKLVDGNTIIDPEDVGSVTEFVKSYIDTLKTPIIATQLETLADIIALSEFEHVNSDIDLTDKTAIMDRYEVSESTANKYTKQFKENTHKRELAAAAGEVVDVSKLDQVRQDALITIQNEKAVDAESRAKMVEYVNNYIDTRKQLYYADPVEYLASDTTLTKYDDVITGKTPGDKYRASSERNVYLRTKQVELGIPDGSIKYMTNANAKLLSQQLDTGSAEQVWNTLASMPHTRDVVNQLKASKATAKLQAYQLVDGDQVEFNLLHQDIIALSDVKWTNDTHGDTIDAIRNSDFMKDYTLAIISSAGSASAGILESMEQLIVASYYSRNASGTESRVEDTIKRFKSKYGQVIETSNDSKVFIVGDKEKQKQVLSALNTRLESTTLGSLSTDDKQWVADRFNATFSDEISKDPFYATKMTDHWFNADNTMIDQWFTDTILPTTKYVSQDGIHHHLTIQYVGETKILTK